MLTMEKGECEGFTERTMVLVGRTESDGKKLTLT